ncbi:hypothetical protein [Clostridium botulinum]|uniref:hypothetical protein n=1 Tax=Clostridium botulinum TaxID=1491 RepID=UPI0004D8E874|nr:hypothetical protein [Clostridium botulinum]KEH99967.1 hypothetical protein Z952_14700 [Clostridium botulinum C/D str. BKT75002]KEI05689.1 hypothetical protein Z954_14880 [Clostridium botulinum C/D str. BKT2873]MCD3351763.1 hypothetical protein [Clostridium botulinum D/C]MCD3360689.1 hypothetical protein [Clostridium botulinum D/C]MCD3362115.1 hypothetical protein [Clostridium botulinum D/C]
MSKEDFYYVEGSTSVKDIIKNLTKEITQNGGAHNWDLVYPDAPDKIKDFSLMKTKTSYGKEFYVRFERTAALTPTSDEQKLLDKEINNKPFTQEEINLVNRYVESMPITSSQKDLIKKSPDTLTMEQQNQLREVIFKKKLNENREIFLLRKYYNGQSLNSSEQNELDTYKNLHNLNATELKEWNELKKKRDLNDSLTLIMYKQYNSLELTSSEQSNLAYYRNRTELTQVEKQKLALLKGQMDNRNHMYITIGKEAHKTKRIEEHNKKQVEIEVVDLVEESCSVPSRLAWYKDLTGDIGEWLPVQYWLNVTTDSVNLILRGDPSADNYPYRNYLTSYAYIGTLKPIEDSACTDDEYNFGVTTSSDIQPFFTKKFGDRTATGVTDVCMVGNKIGMPMQPHYPGFYTTHSFMDKCNTEGSRWNHKKHQFSDITLVHPIDMERGKMRNVLVGDGSAIYDMDKLVYKRDTDEEENYKKFKITAPYSFLNNSSNNLYVLAIRCYKATE